ncbi:hypothetical protein GCM10011586_07050 [Silvibacterium dinghuense]|nr:hypothetical protein GCM10011586_07050 [Silvibacterium dinghuense]
MRGDQVVVRRGSEASDVFAVNGEARGVAVAGRPATLAVKHGRAAVDREDAKAGILAKQAGEKAAVAISEDECMPGCGDRYVAQPRIAAESQPWAESKVFQPAIKPGEAAEAIALGVLILDRKGWRHRQGVYRSIGRMSSGVSRTASAAMRRGSTGRWW